MDPISHRLERARLYFVCDAADSGPALEAMLDAALAGGADLIQLRDKQLDEDGLIAAAPCFRACADRAGALFVLNDRPDLVARCGADGVHVGQADEAVPAARELMPDGSIVGLSTHSTEQLKAAELSTGSSRPDYISVGPVWETPTKPGREATGLAYVQEAAASAELPWFAIGGIDADNIDAVVAAGARRAVVVRAIRAAADPAAAAARLRRALDAVGVPSDE